MNCNCLSEIGDKLAKKFTEQLGVKAEVECQNRGLVLGQKALTVIHLTNYKITAQAKGYTRGKVIPVSANYCPFCGKSAKEEVAA